MSSEGTRNLSTVNKFLNMGVYIKYVERWWNVFTNFSKKTQGTIELDTSWPSNVFKKYFMASPINSSIAFKP